MLNFTKYFFEGKVTLKYHEKLNPTFWKNENFDVPARKRLLQIADFWREYALIPKKAVKDILIVGGNANFNYTDMSDLDLHLLVDKSLIPDCDKELLDEYLKDKKTLWGLTHDVKIYGFPVEIYAQGLDEKYATGQGVYSLKDNKWIQKPVKQQVNYKDPVLIKKINYLKSKIEYFIKHKVDNLDLLHDFQDKIKSMRQSAIRQGGEFSLENLAFKELRNLGLIDKLHEYTLSVEDRSFSLKKKGK